MKKIILLLLFFLSGYLFSKPGKLVILDGLSSSGKTTIVQNLISELDESYEIVALDDYVTKLFLERDSKKCSEDVFQTLIAQEKQRMCDVVIDKLKSGKNILLDIVLFGFNGSRDFAEYLEKFKGQEVILILVYCPLSELTLRMLKRNERAKNENDRANYRPLFLSFKFNQMFKKHEEGEIALGSVNYSDVENAYKYAKKDGIDSKMLDKLKSDLIDTLSLNNQESVNISSRIQYDFIIDTGVNGPEDCAKMMQNFLVNSKEFGAFQENCKKFLVN